MGVSFEADINLGRIERAMKYRATCPTCGHRLTRLWWFTQGWIQVAAQKSRGLPKCACPACGAHFQPNARWSYAAAAAYGAPVFLGLVPWYFQRLSTLDYLLLSAAILVAGILLFPYVTKFQIAPEKNHAA